MKAGVGTSWEGRLLAKQWMAKGVMCPAHLVQWSIYAQNDTKIGWNSALSEKLWYRQGKKVSRVTKRKRK